MSRPQPPAGYNPWQKILVGRFPVQGGRFKYNVWLVFVGLTSHEQLSDSERAYWERLYGKRVKFDGKVKYLAANKLAPKPLPKITLVPKKGESQ